MGNHVRRIPVHGSCFVPFQHYIISKNRTNCNIFRDSARRKRGQKKAAFVYSAHFVLQIQKTLFFSSVFSENVHLQTNFKKAKQKTEESIIIHSPPVDYFALTSHSMLPAATVHAVFKRYSAVFKRAHSASFDRKPHSTKTAGMVIRCRI